MSNNIEINWSNLQKERIVYRTTSETKHLGDNIYSCPTCDGSGRVVTSHRTFSPHGYGKCYMCDGTGEIIKCIHHGCNESVANNQHTNPTKLCCMHEEERIDEIYKKASEQLEKNKR